MTRPEDKTVLVVDDEPNVRMFLQTVLEDANFNVITAEDGAIAWKLIQEERPDFISLDLVLPKMSGRKILRALKKDSELSKIPVLIVTAHAEDELGQLDESDIFQSVWRPKNVTKARGSYLPKPVKPLDYVRCIQEALGIDEDEQTEAKLSVKGEIETLLRGASPEALQAALSALKKA